VFETAGTSSSFTRRKDFFLSATWNPKFGGGSRPWHLAAALGHALRLAGRAGRCGADRADGGDLPVGIRLAPVRAFAKPAIEVLAGIPTIVYGLFALITVGPFLRDWLAQPLGLGDSSSSSVMTAGLVMGIMLIPFVSSLSDDIINAVPQAMRDGSLRPWRHAVRNRAPAWCCPPPCPASSAPSFWPPAAPSARR
jgi:phosphate transport system permease protein